MKRLLTLALAACAAITVHAADAVSTLRGWTALDAFSLAELSSGKIVTSFNSSMSLARGMSCQAAYLVNAPLEITHGAMLKFNSTRHHELDVFQHHVFHDEKDCGFEKLLIDPRSSPVSALIRSMGDPGAIQLAKREIPLMPHTRTAAATQTFLIGILRDRWTSFSKSGDFGSVATYDAGGELRSLLAEEGKVARHFSALLAPLAPKGAPGTPRYHYWDQSTVDKKSAVQLGAVYSLDAPDKRQVLDITYFSTYGYLVSFTIYELHPVTVDGKPQTLICQCSLVSTPAIEGGLGLKRKIGSRMMVSDVEKWIRIFRSDAEKSAR